MLRLSLLAALLAVPAYAEAPKKVVILAGPKSHGPVGNGIHDYGWSAKLIKTMLDHSNIREKVTVEIHLDGWPRHPKSLEDADTIMVISDGRDGDLFQEAPHFASAERVRFMAAQMKRGCGFLTFHFSTFAPQQYAKEILDWNGGYFQWEQNGKKQWYSAITTKEADVHVTTPDHAVSRGLKPLKLREEFYYNLRLSDDATPIWSVPSLAGRDDRGRVVAWVRQRADGGRGFGTTCGHFYDNWKNEQFRALVLNAIAWTAKIEVPANGVASRFFTHEEITRHLEPPIRVLMLAGNEAHRWHNWEKTTVAIRSALEADPRIQVDVVNDPEELGRRKLGDYAVIVQNYANWQDPKPLSDGARKALVDHLKNGGGLIVVHFANGAWHFSLPKAGESDWPEYRRIVRRVWNHHAKPASGHDAFGPFIVEPTATMKHPITDGLKPFEVTDELYYRQDGTERIEPLIQARSRDTKQNEPLAWVYEYGNGRVFQTLLGHSEKTYDAFEPREMLRRAVAWCAGREIKPLAASREPAKPPAALSDGKFGKALNAAVGGAFIAGRKEYRDPPLTAECWAKVRGKSGYHIVLANELKNSATHWELFTEPGNGGLTVYLPGYAPDHVRSNVDVTDDKWHHVRFILEPARVRLTIDGKVVADTPVTFKRGATVEGGFAIGSLVGKELGCGGLIDDVRIMRGVPESLEVPTKPLPATSKTVGLWRFDAIAGGRLADESSLKNSAALESAPPHAASPGPSSPDILDYAAHDTTKWRTLLIDRSDNDSYMAVKCDSAGNLFVGGREGLWVFEPDGRGRFKPRRELHRFPKDSIIIGLEVRGDDLYVLTCSALYLMPGARVKRDHLTTKRLLWGIPVDLHVTFHCMAWGPEGDLYLNHGDPLLNYGDFQRPDHWGHWTWHLADGSKVPYTGTGAVLRIKPDGTNLHVIATGLRGPVGLCFDRNWNLFTNENDHESIPDRYGFVKLLHVSQGVDFGWPRGWMASKSPERKDLIEPMVPSMGRGVPVGLAYIDEPALAMPHQLLQARWDQRAVRRYPIAPRGATFSSEELPLLDGRHIARPTGLGTAPDGRIFTTIHYLPGNVGSPHGISDLVMMVPTKGTTASPEMTTARNDILWSELSHPAWQRRLEAHQEILRRGGPLLQGALARLESTTDDDPAIRHLPWLVAALGRVEARTALTKLLKRSDDVRLIAVQALASLPENAGEVDPLVAMLKDSNPRVQLAALTAFFRRSRKLPFTEVSLLAASKDPYLRQTATRLLARRGNVDHLWAMVNSNNEATALAGVLALGTRLTVPEHHFVPPAELPLTYSNGNAFFSLQYDGEPAPIDLKKLGRTGSFTIAEWWKVARTDGELERLKSLLVDSLNSQIDSVSEQAAYYLSLLRDPQIDPQLQRRAVKRRVDRVTALNLTQSITRAWIIGPIQRAGARRNDDRFPEDGPIDLSAPYGRQNDRRNWFETDLKNAGLNLKIGRNGPVVANEGPVAYLYFRLQSRRRQTIVLPDFSTNIWHNGAKVPVTRDIGMDMELQPGSNDILITTTYVPEAMRLLVEEQVAVVLPDKLDGAELARRLREAKGDDRIPAEFLLVNWTDEMKKGDVANGRKLFGTLACAKCHAIIAEQKGGGAPSLADANKRFTVPHVVESILLPGKQVADAFRSTRLELKTGQSVSGLVVAESNEQVELLLNDGTRRIIAAGDIEERAKISASPMPAGVVKTPAELRDLLAYILSDRPAPP